MRLVYFGCVREALGVDGEDVDFPENVTSIADALDWLTERSTNHASAFADRGKLRFALDQHMAKPDAAIGDASEFAIFPPVTGG